jgi:hypothetical protein
MWCREVFSSDDSRTGFEGSSGVTLDPVENGEEEKDDSQRGSQTGGQYWNCLRLAATGTKMAVRFPVPSYGLGVMRG